MLGGEDFPLGAMPTNILGSLKPLSSASSLSISLTTGAFTPAAIWYPRQLRSGKDFSPYAITPLLLDNPLDFADLLQASVAVELADPDVVAEDAEQLEPEAFPAAADALQPASDAAGPSAKRRLSDISPEEPPHKQKRSNWQRRLKRQAARTEFGHQPTERTMQQVVAPATPITTSLKTEELPVKHGAYAAANVQFVDAKRSWTLEELMAAGFQLVKWNGRDAMPIGDAKRRVWAVLAGQPNDPTYGQAVADAFAAIQREGNQAEFRPQEKDHRRGRFPALAVGISYGNGQMKPMALKSGVEGNHAAMLQRLVGDAAVRRMAAYASSCFSLWAPRVYEYYHERMEIIHKTFPHLKPNFPHSIFACATFNFGPNVCTFKHKDVLNCPFGWCAISALGNFDATQGGHIILWEAKLAIEFPSGSTILIPSATVAHSNLPIARGESRASFTQYCAGGMFRWVDNGCMIESELAAKDPEEYQRICELKAGRWEMGLSLFSTLDELLTTESSSPDVVD